MVNRTVKSSDLKLHLGRYADRVVAGERIAVTSHGRPRYALVPVEDLELLERLEDEADVRAAKKALTDGEFENADDVFRDLGL